jgi:hypothetical protein
MIKPLIFFSVLLCCTPYSAIQLEPTCSDVKKVCSSEYLAIDSICKYRGILIHGADSIVSLYKKDIEFNLTFNRSAIGTNDTIYLSLSYQPNNRLKCARIQKGFRYLPDSVAKNFNNAIFQNTNDLDTSLIFCVETALKVISHNGTAAIAENDYSLGTVCRSKRTRENVMKTVMNILPPMRYSYNKYLRETPGIKGKIIFKFSINEDGRVIYIERIYSTISNCDMVRSELGLVQKAKFDKITDSTDIFTAVYPFVFSQ